MNRKRVIALTKLGILFGGPIALILGLFSCGVYYGHSRRVGILEFEKDWLGMDVEVPSGDDDDAKKKDDEDDAKKKDAEDDADEDDAKKKAEKKAEKKKKNEDDQDDEGDEGDDEDDKPATTPVPAAPTPDTPPGLVVPPPLVDDGPHVDVEVDPDLDSDLKALFDMPLTVRVKVLVDQELIADRADWIDYVQRTVSEASMVYEEQFGITLELSAVGRWPVATAGMDSGQLLEDLRSRPVESADVVVGFTGRSPDDHVSGKAETPLEDSAYNGRVALVYGDYDRGSQRPHLRTMLHEVAHLFGCKDITDRSDPNWLRKSWMSYASVSTGERAWIDAKNRKRVLEAKTRPFPPQDAAPLAEEDTP